MNDLCLVMRTPISFVVRICVVSDYFFEARRKIEEKDELKYYMEAREERTAIRKYRGGWHRGVAYVLR